MNNALTLTATPKRTAFLPLLGVTAVARVWWSGHGVHGAPLPWTWWIIVPSAVLIALGVALMVKPARLMFGESELVSSTLFTKKRYEWVALERAGVANTAPTLISNRTPNLIAGSLGLVYRRGYNPILDEAKASYRRGLTGYDINIVTRWFAVDASFIVEEANKKISQARNALPTGSGEASRGGRLLKPM